MEESFRASIERGELVPILEDYCPRFAGFTTGSHLLISARDAVLQHVGGAADRA